MPGENRILEELAALRADTLAAALRELSADVRASQTAQATQQTEIHDILVEIRHATTEIRADMRASSSGSLQSKLADAFITSDWRGRAAFLALPALCLVLAAAWVSGERLTDILSSGAAIIHGPAHTPTEKPDASP